ncbi:hypothetical protein F8M41_015062 [Gigaspora margarita]|uniref:Uncharacterized protein n=1 Tax=Gigaspora margarita TaxID=4874 RepID=A0A8H4ENP8_GIGMA|nr:hypothetical protein F8M41_015062 [Gigaspora margarita]
MPLSILLESHIIKSNEKLSKSNIKVFCKACVEVLGAEAGKKITLSNKMDRIIQHLKKCVHFVEKMIPEEKDKIFSLSKDNDLNEKRPVFLITLHPIPPKLLQYEKL